MSDKHPSFGRVPPDEFRKAMESGVPTASNILRKFEPTFGLPAGTEKKEYKVRFYRTATTEERATEIIEAYSQEEAEALANQMDHDNLDWSYSSSGNADESYVESVEEA
ncbi:MAG: hypothetical protein LAP61_05735 [Acidobacteriia bacterium]|nr:hypothetical protein [Terriglobia bacterium]